MTSIISKKVIGIFENGSTRTLEKGATLFNGGDTVKYMYLVAQGRLDLVRLGANGSQMILMSAGPNQIFAEASAYAGSYHCDGIAGEKSTIIACPVTTFIQELNSDCELAHDWAAGLARATQGARLLAEIRTLRTVADRLDAWLGETGVLPDKGTWQNLADTLGVSKEALYRELARRRTKQKLRF